MSEDGHSVAILDVHGVRMEWNGDDYVSVEGGEGGGAAGAGEAGGGAGSAAGHGGERLGPVPGVRNCNGKSQVYWRVT